MYFLLLSLYTFYIINNIYCIKIEKTHILEYIIKYIK